MENNYARAKGNMGATANWDFENDSFRTCYSTQLILDKEAEKQTIIGTEKPSGNELYLTFIFIGFLKQDLKKQIDLHRKHNNGNCLPHSSTLN